MDPQIQNTSSSNQMPVQPVSSQPKSSGSSQVALGVFIGIIQLIIWLFVVFASPLNVIFGALMNSVGSLFLPVGIVIGIIPLLVEVLIFRKTNPLFCKGALIGTILTPLIGLGLCFILAYSGAFKGI